MRRGVALLLPALLLPFAAPVATAQVGPQSPACIARSKPPDVGLRLLKEKRAGRRVDLTLRSSAMVGETRYGVPGIQPVKVLLPVGYDPSGATRYPVLYFLHGFTGLAEFNDGLKLPAAVGSRRVIVVMPDGGYNGAYTDWYGRLPGIGGDGEPPAWETYHIKELVPFIDKHFPTIRTRGGRAVAGISGGGFGAMKYAARHPDLFGAAGAMSGSVNVTQDGPALYPTIDFLLNNVTLLPGAGPASNCKFGDPYTQQVFWENNNPFYLATNLRGVALWLTSGDGGDGTEDYIRRMNQWFIMALQRAKIPYTNTFRPGTHSAPFWTNDLKRLMPWVMKQFAKPASPPQAFSYRGVSNLLQAWGWTFVPNKAVKEFTYVDRASKDGFTISGSGRVRVVTAPVYRPGGRYVIRATGGRLLRTQATNDGRLKFNVDLGPAHDVQQYRFECLCWNDMDERSGLVNLLGDDPEMRADWVTRTIRVSPAH